MPIRLNTTGGALAKAGLGGGDALGMLATGFHKQPQLLACDVSSGHFGPRLVVEEPILPAHAAASRRGLKPASPVGLA